MELRVIFVLSLVLLLGGTWAKPKPTYEIFYVYLFEGLHREPPMDKQETRDISPVVTKWIEQKLDNFDANNTETWKMRYMQNDAYYESGGPIFIYVGAEWTITESALTSTHIVDMAKENKGCLFYTEHRYYGQSHPTKDMSVDNLKYLEVRQALADLANFVRTTKATLPGAENSKVILVGGSYAATMVTWFIKLYPELANGGWASSGPLLTKLNFIEYEEVVGKSILDVGTEKCYKRIENSFAQMQQLFQTNRGAEVKSMFKLCNNFNENKDLDVWNLFNEISEVFSLVVQYASEGDIDKMCEHFSTDREDYINLANFVLQQLGTAGMCNDMSYNTMLKGLQDTTYNNNMMRQWTYQTCNEFGWFQSSDSRNQPFGSQFPVDFFTTLCADLFGEKFTKEYISNQVKATNAIFNGLEPGVENVFFTQGVWDPWKSMGINDNVNGAVIPRASHCMDLKMKSPKDSVYLNAARDIISKLVKEWVQDS